MINRGGENVYCVEVENALAAAPGVFEVAVLGVPDQMMGEKVGAVIVPTPGRSSTRRRSSTTPAPTWPTSRCRSTWWCATRSSPRNAGGKVLKPVLRTETEWGEPLR